MVANDDQERQSVVGSRQSHDEVTNDDDGAWFGAEAQTVEAVAVAVAEPDVQADDDYAGDTIMLPLIFWHD